MVHTHAFVDKLVPVVTYIRIRDRIYFMIKSGRVRETERSRD